MSKLDDECRQRIEDIRRWFESLPEGVAEMRIETSDNPALPPVTVEIRPLLHPDAALIWVHFEDHRFHVGMERAGTFEGILCSESVVDYCRAIASGGLTVVERLWRGRVVSARTELDMESGTESMEWADAPGCLLGLFRWLFRGREERAIRYPPYH